MSEVGSYGDVDEYADPDEGPPQRPPLTPAQKRARRQAITLLVVGLVLLVAFLFAAAYYGGWFSSPKAKAGVGSCPTTTAAASKVKPSQVHVNVYNASKRNGLAKKVSGELKTQGYVTGKVANDPLGANLKTTPAEVRYGAKGKAGAELVASEVKGAKLVLDKRKDATVDLVLGASYATLGAPPSATPTNPNCHPSATATGSSTAKSTAKSTPKSSTTTKKP